jgi:hypothetical protein
VSLLAAERPPDDFAEQLAALDIRLFVTSTASTIAGLVYTKLDRRDLPQAKLGIDVLAALTPLLDGPERRDLEAALANLQVAYADAVTKPDEPAEQAEPAKPEETPG